MDIYDLSIRRADGTEQPLGDFRGKVLLIVNTATECGFTPQYAPLQRMYGEYGPRGLEIIDVPCDQFGNQAPGTDEEIHGFCTGRFGVTFPQYAKSEVRGPGAIPLFRYLADNTRFEGFGKGPKALMMAARAKRMDKGYRDNGEVKWNFTKFLVDRQGRIVARFEPTRDMEDVESAVRDLI